jgi:hypothetical protein
MSDDSSGWGQDYDEDGNVIGDVPDGQNDSLISNHPGKLIGVWVLCFSFALFNNQSGLSGGFVMGAGAMSFVFSFILVYAYVWVRY